MIVRVRVLNHKDVLSEYKAVCPSYYSIFKSKYEEWMRRESHLQFRRFNTAIVCTFEPLDKKHRVRYSKASVTRKIPPELKDVKNP